MTETTKLNTASVILKLGHDTFSKNDLSTAAVHILNNTRMLVQYDRAALIDMRDKPNLIGVSNSTIVEHNSEYAIQIKKLVTDMADIKKPTLLTDDIISTYNIDKETVKYFKDINSNILIIPLVKSNDKDAGSVFWILEFFNTFDNVNMGPLALLSQHYSEAIWYFITSKNYMSKLLNKKHHFTPLRICLYLVILFIIISFFGISQSVSTAFELIPKDETISYAPFAGKIIKSNFKDGDKVEKDDIVLQYDTQEFDYNLADATSNYNEITAELDWTTRKSFLNNNELGKLDILSTRQEKEKINIDKSEWYLDRTSIKAKSSGILILNDSEKWDGKVVRRGNELFQVIPPNSIEAEILLNEADASVLYKDTKITLYLHASPETPIYGKIFSISTKPILTKTGQFCYVIKLKLDKIDQKYIVGMRGIARVTGKRVSIGYYLFRNLVLWWRKI